MVLHEYLSFAKFRKYGLARFGQNFAAKFRLFRKYSFATFHNVSQLFTVGDFARFRDVLQGSAIQVLQGFTSVKVMVFHKVCSG